MIKIGYQGDIGSNSEEAAKQFAKKINLKEYELIPLIESKNVVLNLKENKIDFGIMAIENSIGGQVLETLEAIKNESLEVISKIILPIHHCIFVKQNIDKENIKFITSHIQALKQTRINRSFLFPNWKEIEGNDTALAAKNLYENTLNDDYAIICRKNAGELYNLKLIYENIEDDKNNKTTFGIFKLV